MALAGKPVGQALINKQKTHCPSGHPYSPENTLYRRKGRMRACKACYQKHSLRSRVKEKAKKEAEKALLLSLSKVETA